MLVLYLVESELPWVGDRSGHQQSEEMLLWKDPSDGFNGLEKEDTDGLMDYLNDLVTKCGG